MIYRNGKIRYLRGTTKSKDFFYLFDTTNIWLVYFCRKNILFSVNTKPHRHAKWNLTIDSHLEGLETGPEARI